MFEDVFQLTEPAGDPRSAIEAMGLPNARPRKPGVYRDGLFALVSDAFDAGCLQNWPLMKAGRFTAIAYTGLGDFFLWDHEKNVVQYFELQYAESNVAANTIDAFLDELLPQERIVENVLRRPLVEELVRLYGALHYLECFILEPWQFLGGEEDPKNFKKGDVCVNADLVAQTMVQMS